jgi:hypothetical protein
MNGNTAKHASYGYGKRVRGLSEDYPMLTGEPLKSVSE